MALPPPPAAPDQASLREVALRHLARYAATEAGLLRVLSRRVSRWARAAEPDEAALAAAQQAARLVVAQLAGAGAVNDAVFAEGRARSLRRAGRSRRAIAAHLQAKGVPAGLAAQPEDPAAELSAALLYAARRRLGPFRATPSHETDPARRQRDLARLARAGFPAEIAMRVLTLPEAEAEEAVLQARRG